MASIGDKYIIEIRDLGVENDTYYLRNSVVDYIVVPGKVLQGFEKYDPESDYQRGLNDAWEAARKIAGAPSLGGLTTHEVMELFGTSLATEVVYMVTADQAIEKLRTYEAEKKAEEEIRVGDEVETDYIGNGIITRKAKDDGWYVVIDKDFYRHAIHKSHIVRKTGRHFPQIDELLAEMRGDNDD